MCMVYSGYLLDNLRREHAICRLVDTNDLGLDYQHQFILVNNGEEYYLHLISSVGRMMLNKHFPIVDQLKMYYMINLRKLTQPDEVTQSFELF